jgi:hypothetical protein
MSGGIMCPKCGQAATYLNSVVICPRCDASPRDASPSSSPPPLSPTTASDSPTTASDSPTTTTASEFDPYHQWLGIPQASQPADHYRLLGIQRFESNPDVIENAADRQMAHVRSFAIGPRADHSQQILNEISSARVCLLNSVSKATYDQQIAASTSQHSPQRNAPQSRDNAGTPLASYIPRKKRVVQDRSQVPKIILVVVGGLVGVAIASFLLNQIREKEAQRARAAFQRSQPIVTGRQRPIGQRRQTTKVRSRLKNSDQQVNPPPPVEQVGPGDSHAKSTTAYTGHPDPESDPTVDPIDRPIVLAPTSPSSISPAAPLVTKVEPLARPNLSNLPDDIDLPPVSSRVVEKLISKALPDDLEITLVSELITLDSAYAFVAKKDISAATAQWMIYLQKELDVGTEQEQVAVLTVDESGLTFLWTDSDRTLPSGQLRNCLLQLKSETKSHQIALRSPLRPTITGLPAEKDRFKTTFELADLPRSECLRLEIEIAYNGTELVTQSGTDTTKKGKRLVFKIDGPDDVEIQATLLSQRDASLIFQALPRYKLGSRQITLSQKDVDDVEKKIRQSILKAQRGIMNDQNDLRTAQNRFNNANSSAEKAVQSRIVTQETKAIALKKGNIAEMQKRLGSIGNLRDLVSTIRQETLIRYRVYAESNASFLLLVDGGIDAGGTARPASKTIPARVP